MAYVWNAGSAAHKGVYTLIPSYSFQCVVRYPHLTGRWQTWASSEWLRWRADGTIPRPTRGTRTGGGRRRCAPVVPCSEYPIKLGQTQAGFSLIFESNEHFNEHFTFSQGYSSQIREYLKCVLVEYTYPVSANGYSICQVKIVQYPCSS
jgi:hypothetical protein